MSWYLPPWIRKGCYHLKKRMQDKNVEAASLDNQLKQFPKRLEKLGSCKKDVWVIGKIHVCIFLWQIIWHTLEISMLEKRENMILHYMRKNGVPGLVKGIQVGTSLSVVIGLKAVKKIQIQLVWKFFFISGMMRWFLPDSLFFLNIKLDDEGLRAWPSIRVYT